MTNKTSTLDAPVPYKSESGWFDKPMRWAQLTLVEDDPKTLDVAFWLGYFKRIKADAACLSAGGYMAFYPTDIPLHYRSKFLGDTDPFGNLVRGCREMNMVVLARTDPHAVHQDVYEAHPDWIAVDAEGKQASALGNARCMGHLSLWPLQLRLHDAGSPGNSERIRGRRHFQQPLGGLRAVLLRTLSRVVRGRSRYGFAAD